MQRKCPRPARRRAGPGGGAGRRARSRRPERPRARRRAAPRPRRRARAARARPSGRRGRRPAARPLRKRKSGARRVGRAPLAPHRAPGARAVRVICFSCGRTRPATICQSPPAGSRREAGRGTRRRGAARPPRARAGAGGWASRRDRTARAPRSRSRCSRRPHRGRAQVLLARTRPCQTWPPAAARPGTRDGSAARLPASRASAALRVSCTSRCSLDVRLGLWPCGLHTPSRPLSGLCACKPGRFLMDRAQWRATT